MTAAGPPVSPGVSGAAVAAAARILAAGGAAIYPTETFYALGADPRSATGTARVLALKDRPPGKPLPWIAADLAQVRRVCHLPPQAEALAGRAWPGAVTLVLRCRPTGARIASSGTAADGTVAIRVSAHSVARALARALGHPVISTSANRSGAPPPTRLGEAFAGLGGPADGRLAVLDGGRTPGGSPSVIVDATAATLRILRGSLAGIPGRSLGGDGSGIAP